MYAMLGLGSVGCNIYYITATEQRVFTQQQYTVDSSYYYGRNYRRFLTINRQLVVDGVVADI